MLISFEGGDRCGKTTQINLLKERIGVTMKKDPISLKHPDRSTPSGKIINSYLKKEIDLSNDAITLCLTSNLWDTSNVINTHIKSGEIVLIDRYIHTNLAYSMIRGVKRDKLEKMMEGIQKPDVVVYLRASKSVSDRAGFGVERYETVEIQNSVHTNFDQIFLGEKNSKIIIVDSSKSIDEISNTIWESVRPSLATI